MKDLEAVDPDRLGPFQLLRVLGKGGMGKVYLGCMVPSWIGGPDGAADYLLPSDGELEEGAFVAVKIIKPESSSDNGRLDTVAAYERFRREIFNLQAVVGPRVPAFQGAAREGDEPWLAIDYVHGPDLNRYVKKAGVMTVAQVAALGLGMAEALRSIHDAKLLHRDLKPHNVVLGPNGPVVVDFGLAVLAERDGAAAVTTTGLPVGTVAYMPPEQFKDGKHVDESADVYSIGATLYYAAKAKPPYSWIPSETPPEWGGIAPALVGVLAKIMAPNPSSRPELDEIEALLQELLDAEGLDQEEALRQIRQRIVDEGLLPVLPDVPESEGLDAFDSDSGAAEEPAPAQVRESPSPVPVVLSEEEQLQLIMALNDVAPAAEVPADDLLESPTPPHLVPGSADTGPDGSSGSAGSGPFPAQPGSGGPLPPSPPVLAPDKPETPEPEVPRAARAAAKRLREQYARQLTF